MATILAHVLIQLSHLLEAVVENSGKCIMVHQEIDKGAIKKYSGRGEVKIIKKSPEQRRTDEKHKSR